MKHEFKVGDHVSWNSEAGRVSGTIIRVRVREFKVKGYTHHASADDPQYEIRAARRTISPSTRVPRSPSLAIDVSMAKLAMKIRSSNASVTFPELLRSAECDVTDKHNGSRSHQSNCRSTAQSGQGPAIRSPAKPRQRGTLSWTLA